MDDALKAVEHLPLYETLRRWFAGDPEVSTVAAYTDMRLLSTASGQAIVAFNADKRFANAGGTLQGGILTAVADATMGLAFITTLQGAEGFATLELKMNFLKAIANGGLRFTGTVVHRGKRTGLVECGVTDEKGNLVARGSSTCIVLPEAGKDRADTRS
jgi:uncharacterized protein (TIGR00369 family)